MLARLVAGAVLAAAIGVVVAPAVVARSWSGLLDDAGTGGKAHAEEKQQVDDAAHETLRLFEVAIATAFDGGKTAFASRSDHLRHGMHGFVTQAAPLRVRIERFRVFAPCVTWRIIPAAAHAMRLQQGATQPMIHVLAIITAKPGQREAILEAFRANMPAVHAEAGCIEYGPAIDAEGAGGMQTQFGSDSFVVIEKWESLDHLKAHSASAHMAEYAAKTRPMIANRVIHVLSPAA